MTVGYVLVNCDLGAEEDLVEKISQIEQVKDVFETFGTHDIMVRLNTDHLEKLREIVTWEIQNLDKVRSTVTLIKKD